MNKSAVKQKRSSGNYSPLSKRPKLDLSLSSKDYFEESSNGRKEFSDVCKNVMKEKPRGNSSENEKFQDLSTSDWDDDFSGDMLEKVCLIADLSQAMVNDQSVSQLGKDEIDFLNKKLSPKSIKPSPTTVETTDSFKAVKLQLEKLQDKLKMKEGEVHILRSQLKQNEDSKQAIALQNIKNVEEIQGIYNVKFNAIEKELESTKSKLLFKDMEYKTLSERCRQLEFNLSKSKLAATQNVLKPFKHFSQAPNLTSKSKVTFFGKWSNLNDNSMRIEYFTPAYHEGKNLAKLLCPEFFKSLQEPSVIPFYVCNRKMESHKNKLCKIEKYEWSDLPKRSVHLKDLYKDVGSLFICECFTQREVIEIINTIFNTCEKILHHEIQTFTFVDKLRLRNIEYEKADRCLLEEEEKVEVITIKNVLNNEKLKKEECGIELRRSLGLIYCLVKVSKTAFDVFKTNIIFIKFLRDIVAIIGKVRRPLRYTGVLVGICFILQKLLEDKSLSKEHLTLITETVGEMIFARPKLDVLREVINILAAGKYHMRLLGKMCRRESVDSCMLYMDCKLKQAMFFTKNACPLKLLCMQIMGLACLPHNQDIRWDITDCVIKWLNSSLSSQNSKNLKWLPVHPGFMEDDKCFNVTECLLYLLILCLNDYNHNFLSQNSFEDDFTIMKSEREKKKNYLTSIIGQGAVLFKRILKADQRQLHENSYSLRFSILLKAFKTNKLKQYQVNHAILSSVEIEAISWINDLLESELRVQDFCLKQNLYALSDIDELKALKINDETKIY